MEKHFTVTAFIIQEEKVLLHFHQKLQKWLPPGGHIEANETPIEALHREVLEECQMEITLLAQENLWAAEANASSFIRPYLCLLEEIPEHKGVPAHQHIDLIYLAVPVKGEAQDPFFWISLSQAQELYDQDLLFPETWSTIQHLLKEAVTERLSAEQTVRPC